MVSTSCSDQRKLIGLRPLPPLVNLISSSNRSAQLEASSMHSLPSQSILFPNSSQQMYNLPDWNYSNDISALSLTSTSYVEDSSRQTPSIDLLGLLHSSGISLPENNESFSDFPILPGKDVSSQFQAVNLAPSIVNNLQIVNNKSTEIINNFVINGNRINNVLLPTLNQVQNRTNLNLTTNQRRENQNLGSSHNTNNVGNEIELINSEEINFTENIVSVSNDLSLSLNSINHWEALNLISASSGTANLQNDNLQNSNLQNGILQNGILPNGILQNGSLHNSSLQNSSLQNGILQNGKNNSNWKNADDILISSQTISDDAAALTSVLNGTLPDVTEMVFASAVEEIHCYKCKFCPSVFISLYRDEALAHLTSVHEKELFELEKHILETAPLPPWNTVASFNQHREIEQIGITPAAAGPGGVGVAQEEEHGQPGDFGETGSQEEMPQGNYVCGKCHESFVTLPECRRHMSEIHGVKSSRIRLERNTQNNQNSNKKKTASPAKKDLLEKNGENSTTENLRKDENKGKETKKKKKGGKKNETGNAETETTTTGIVPGRKRKAITPLQKMTRDRLTAHQGCYICEFKGCNVRFKMLDNLEYHCKCHIGGLGTVAPSFACPECGYRTEYWSSMAGHLWRHHVIDLELHACDQCSFRTFSLSKLENLHKRIHREERPYPCDHCPKSFKTSKQLWTHKAFHLDEGQPYQIIQCLICNRRFSDKRMLRFHLDTVHYKMRPFLCHCCGYSASCRSTLKMHLRQHTGEKPFACDSCDYRTSDHNSLRRHKMRHSGEKPYKCPYCTYACIQSTTYKAHLKSKHPGQNTGLMFSCEVCPFRTIKQDIFLTHIADHKLEERMASSVAVPNGMNSSSSPCASSNGGTTGPGGGEFLEEQQTTLTLVEAVQFSLSQTSNISSQNKILLINSASEADKETNSISSSSAQHG